MWSVAAEKNDNDSRQALLGMGSAWAQCFSLFSTTTDNHRPLSSPVLIYRTNLTPISLCKGQKHSAPQSNPWTLTFIDNIHQWDSSPPDLNQDLLWEPSFVNILRTKYSFNMKTPPKLLNFFLNSEWHPVRMVIKPMVPTALDLLALVHWNLHHMHFLNICFAAVSKRRLLDSTWLTQGPTLHHLTLRRLC